MSVAEGDAHVTERTEGETARHERRRGGTRRPVSPAASSPPRKVLRQPERLHVSLGRFRGTLRAGVSREGPRVTDSGPKASPSQGPAAAEGGICHERGRGRRSCHRTHRGRNRTPREAAREKVSSPLPLRPLLPRAVPRHFARRRAMGGAEGDVFRHGRGRGRRISARERPPCGVLRQPTRLHEGGRLHEISS